MKKRTRTRKNGKSRKILPFFIFIALIITIFLGWESRKKVKISKNEEKDRVQRGELEIEDKPPIEENEEKDQVIRRPKITRGEILSLLFQAKQGELEYTLIEIEEKQVNITGKSAQISDVYRLEKALRDAGGESINSDYIKKDGEKIEFKMDLSLKNYGAQRMDFYIPEKRRIFETPTEQRDALAVFLSKRCEIISIGRSQKREFSPGITETGIPYHIRGDISSIINLLLALEEGGVFLSLLEEPIKLILSGEEGELYFKIIGYSGDYS